MIGGALWTPVFLQPHKYILVNILELLSFYISIWAFQKLLTSICMLQNRWIFDKRFTCGRKEEAWKGESKKELPMGQAVTGNFLCLPNCQGNLVLMFLGEFLCWLFFLMFQSHLQGCIFLLWQVSALCCGFSSQHKSLDLLLFSWRSFPACIDTRTMLQFGFCFWNDETANWSRKYHWPNQDWEVA